MIANDFAQQSLGSRSNLLVLRVLVGVSAPLTARQIGFQTGLSRPALDSALNRLINLGIVELSRSGNARTYQIERSNILVKKVIEPLFDIEDNLRAYMTQDIAHAFEADTDSIVLFGSFAREEQAPESDVDVLFVAPNQLQKRTVELKLNDYLVRFHNRFGHSLGFLVYDDEEARSLRKRAPALFEEIKEDGLLISGTADWMKNA